MAITNVIVERIVPYWQRSRPAIIWSAHQARAPTSLQLTIYPRTNAVESAIVGEIVNVAISKR
jgi:hypothetical protein